MKNINGFYIDDEQKIHPPITNLPDAVIERIEYFNELREDGATFLGVMQLILVDENCSYIKQILEEYDMFATKPWIPKSKEFREWEDKNSFGLADAQIAVALLYGINKGIK
ncbi:hypothetical protein BG261_02885 [Floricoccus tropicus]|uniref:Uncharacterized protein n=2 Tax=Floricoccus tropicus TaxID=1859473 RepID=A0A1E8GN73_9LACT|nr:hypothetical protein BG261_02885 [Floricoccus tropicus]